MDDLTPEQHRKNMQAIKSKDTSIELALRKALWYRGIDFVAKLDISSQMSALKVVVLGEAKCEKLDKPINGIHIARTEPVSSEAGSVSM